MPACSLSPAAVQKYPIIFGLISLPVKGGLGNAGVGTWRTGSGGARLLIGSVKPGTDGIKGGNESGFGSASAIGEAETMIAV